MSWTWGLAAVLVLWAGIAALRRGAETAHRRYRPPDVKPGGASAANDPAERDGDGIDYDELRRAEEEVKGLDAFQKPEDGFSGDDWGPGATRPPW